MSDATRPRLRALPARRDGVLRLLRGREDATTLGLLAYLAAFLVVPALHLVNHQLDHHHGADQVDDSSSFERVQPHGHVHAGEPATPPESRGPLAPEHGHGAVEHFATALKATATFVFCPVSTPVLDRTPTPLRSRIHGRLDAGCAQPRGPPTAV